MPLAWGFLFLAQGGQVASPKVQKRRTRNREARITSKLEKYRAAWIEAREMHPEWGISALQKNYSGLDSWLRKCDPEWLKAHLPPRSTPIKKGWSPERWKTRDIEMAEQVRSSALRLRNAPGRPIRITLLAIGEDLNQPGFLTHCRRKLDKLPLMAQVLDEVLEGSEAFAVRRIWWLAERYRQQGILPTRTQLIQLTHVGKYLATSAQVRDVVDAAMLHAATPALPKSLETGPNGIEMSILRMESGDIYPPPEDPSRTV